MTETLRSFLVLIGTALIVMGAVILFYLGFEVFSILHKPEDVRVVQFVMENVKAETLAFSGTMRDTSGRQNIMYELNMSASVRTLVFLAMGVGMLGILAATLRALIGGGVSILKLANTGTKNEPEN